MSGAANSSSLFSSADMAGGQPVLTPEELPAAVAPAWVEPARVAQTSVVAWTGAGSGNRRVGTGGAVIYTYSTPM